MSMDQPTWNQAPEPPQRSSGSKLWVILGIGLGLGVLLCCGGPLAFFFVIGNQVKNMPSFDPASIRQGQAETVDIAIPPELPPLFKFDFKMPLVNQRMMLLTYFGKPRDPNLIWLAASGPFFQQQIPNEDDLRTQLDTNLRAQSQTGQAGAFKQLTATAQHAVDVTVNGKASKINVVEGTDSEGKKYIQATGMFESKTGPTLLNLQLDADRYTVEQVDTIVKSMK